MPLIMFVLLWLLGIMLADYVHPPLVPLLLGSAATLSLRAVWRLGARGKLLLGLCAVLLGASRFAWAQAQPSAKGIDQHVGQWVMLQGTVAAQPDRREDRQTAILAQIVVITHGRPEPSSGQILLQLPPLPEIDYGMHLQASGVLIQPTSTPSFDYRAYLQRRGVVAVLNKATTTRLPGFGGSSLLRPLLQLNDVVRGRSRLLLPEPHAALLTSLLLGVRATLPKAVLRDFTATGTGHILIISGWNITLVVTNAIILLIEVGMTRRQADWAAVIILTLYVCLVGATPSVLRAAVVASLVILADLVGRPGWPWTLLLTACGFLTLIDPHSMWDVSFQLSALAAAGLFAFTPGLEEHFQRIPLLGRSPLIVAPLAATLGASVLTLPILLINFGQLALVAPLANLLLLPAVPFAMAFGTIAIVVNWLIPVFGQVIAYFSWPFLQWLLVVTHLLAKLPGAALAVPSITTPWIWAYYVLMVGGWTGWQWARHAASQARAEAQLTTTTYM